MSSVETGVPNLGDIPDLSSVGDAPTSEPWEDAWYEGSFLERRAFTDQNGNERVFASEDTPAQSGDSRNIRLQVAITRQADGRVLNTSTLVNYRPGDLTTETINAVTERRKQNGEQMGDLFRPFMTLTRLSKLQKIAKVRQFQRNGNGGLDLTPVYGKSAYFRLRPDPRNTQYKEIADYREDRPKKATVL